MNDILELLYLANPYKKENLNSIVIGEKCVGVMLKNGNIGVVSTLKNNIGRNIIKILSNPNFSDYSNRIIVNAWVNACVNYSEPTSGNDDIFEAINFSNFQSIVMVGYFGSLANKIKENGIKFTAFDLNEQDNPVEPIANQKRYLGKADCVILTSTTLANQTYRDIQSYTNENCKVYLLGPSTPLSKIVFENLHISGLFGAKFKPFDFDVLKSIESGGGTRSFLHKMEKVYILNPKNRRPNLFIS